MIGGIVGDMSGSDEYTSEISNCYNIGNISSDRILGGIVGQIDGDNNNIKYCYNMGTLKGKGSSSFKGSIVGNKYGGIIQNCYYSNTSEIKAVKNEDDETNNVYGLEKEFMKTTEFVNLLNAGNKNEVWKLAEVDYKYPVLSWQTTYPDFSEEVALLTGIAVTKAPDDTNYIAGQNFDKTGMVVTATYNDGSTKEVTNYTVTDGTNLTAGKTSVTISYTENRVTKTTTQRITVVEKAITGIAVTTAPTRTTYIAGQNFDKTGMVVTATYNDGSTKEVTNYTVIDGANLTAGKTSVTISYTENGVTKTTTQNITVTERLSIKIDESEEVEKDGNRYIESINPSTTVKDILKKVSTNGSVEIYKGTEKITNENTKLATGMKLKISLENEQIEYTVVVTGDLNGDGKMGDVDVLKLARYKAGLDNSLSGAYLEATNIHRDNNYADDIDLLKMVRILVGLDSLTK